jgi:2'-5' RNA ligase
MAFLGSLNPIDLAKAKASVTTFKSRHETMKLKLSKLFAFPEINRAKVIIAKISGRDIKKLHKLVGALRRDLKKRKLWYDQKPFVPHITLARTKRKINLHYFLKEQRQINQTQFELRQLHLYCSRTGTGSSYQKLF